jgi:hypothetical protein
MNCYSYVISRDFGFAPNPFYGYCTLATCKPRIRKSASIGDWVIGCGAAAHKRSGFLIYAMQVNEKLDFNDYWSRKEFEYKKPIMNGSLKQMYGDNVYHYDCDQGRWIQSDCHHSHEDGTENEKNMKRDLSSLHVLISWRFWYFGGSAIEIPKRFRQKGFDISCFGRSHRITNNESLITQFISWIENIVGPGYHGDPFQFATFKRYKGES